VYKIRLELEMATAAKVAAATGLLVGMMTALLGTMTPPQAIDLGDGSLSPVSLVLREISASQGVAVLEKRLERAE